MKKFLMLFILLFLYSTSVFAADRYWIGDSGNWNNTAEWSDSSGGAGGQTVPGSSDTAIFDAASFSDNSTVTVNIDATVDTFTVAAGSLDEEMYLELDNNLTVTNTFSMNGADGADNRAFVFSADIGTSHTITAGTVSVTNTDFRDITGAGAGSWDLSGVTGNSGDCGGNTDITFTTARDLYWVGGNGEWNEPENSWGTSSGGAANAANFPLCQDTAYFDNNSAGAAFYFHTDEFEGEFLRVGTIDTSGCTSYNITKDTVSTYGALFEIYGSIDFSEISTYYADDQFYYGRDGAYTIEVPTLAAGGGRFNVHIGTGSLTLNSNYTMTDGAGLNRHSITAGTFDLNDFDIYMISSISLDETTYNRTVTFGDGTWTARNGYYYDSSVLMFDVNPGTNLTINSEGSLIYYNDDGTRGTTHDGNGFTWNNITFESNDGGGGIRIKGTSTFDTITVEPYNTVSFTDGTTQTISSLVATGTSGNTIELKGTSTAGWTISDSSGTNQVEYCTISYSTAEGGADWLAYTSDNNTDNGNNSGWVFTAPSSAYQRGVMIFD